MKWVAAYDGIQDDLVRYLHFERPAVIALSNMYGPSDAQPTHAVWVQCANIISQTLTFLLQIPEQHLSRTPFLVSVYTHAVSSANGLRAPTGSSDDESESDESSEDKTPEPKAKAKAKATAKVSKGKAKAKVARRHR